MKKFSLEAAVLLCGAATMILELTGSRIMAPYVGTSIYVWTSLIGVILASLSAGYWLGGRLADRDPKPGILSAVILASALWIALVAVGYDLVLLRLSALPDVRWVATIGAAMLFGVPSVLLGIVLPYAAKLKLHRIQETGRTVGDLYALSTIGSILGTFLAGFVLIAYLKNSTIFLVLCALLVLSSFLVSRAAVSLKILVLFFSAAATQTPDLWAAKMYGPDFVDANTRYSRVWIYDLPTAQGDMMRLMQINDEMSSTRLFGEEKLGAVYTRYYRLCDHFVPGLKTALMLGGAAYVYPMDFIASHPNATLDVVELDPGVTQLAREYFGLKDDPRLTIHHEDARTFLHQNARRYDVIFGDVFRSIALVPFHLTTVEMMRSVKASLNENGVYFMNVIGSIEGKEGQFLRAEIITMKKVFPQVHVIAVRDRENPMASQNFLLVGLNSPALPKFYSHDRELNSYLRNLWIKPIPEIEPVLTDDYAPIERYHRKGWPEKKILRRMKTAWRTAWERIFYILRGLSYN